MQSQATSVGYFSDSFFSFLFQFLYIHRTFDFCNRALSFHLENRCGLWNRVFDLTQNYFRVW